MPVQCRVQQPTCDSSLPQVQGVETVLGVGLIYAITRQSAAEDDDLFQLDFRWAALQPVCTCLRLVTSCQQDP